MAHYIACHNARMMQASAACEGCTPIHCQSLKACAYYCEHAGTVPVQEGPQTGPVDAGKQLTRQGHCQGAAHREQDAHCGSAQDKPACTRNAASPVNLHAHSAKCSAVGVARFRRTWPRDTCLVSRIFDELAQLRSQVGGQLLTVSADLDRLALVQRVVEVLCLLEAQVEGSHPAPDSVSCRAACCCVCVVHEGCRHVGLVTHRCT